MPTTPNMSLVLPTVSSTVGPDWAEQLNTAFGLIDSHDHSSGEGVPITPAGMNISSNLTFNNFYATSVGSLRLTNQPATLATPSDVRALYAVNGDLYYNNSAGAAVQITSGGSVIAASDGIARSFSRAAVASNTIISAAATTSYYDVDTTTSVTFTLPAANAVSAGRFYEFKDTTGSAGTNNIIINRAGADTIDGATSVTINTNYGGRRLISDGASKWAVSHVLPNRVQTNDIQDSAVTTAKINDGAVTQAKRAALGQQVSSSTGLTNTTSTTPVDISPLSVTITTTGRPVFICLVGDYGAGTGNRIVIGSSASDTSITADVNIVRGSTTILNAQFGIVVLSSTNNISITLPASSVWHIDTPSAGTYTYKIQANVSGANESVTLARLRLMAFEL